MSKRSNLVHADLRNRHYCAWRQFLRDSDNWSAEQIEEYQLNEIRRIVRYAYEKTKAYHALYDSAGIKPEAIKAIEDTRRLPFVEKETIRNSLEDFSVKIRGRSYVTTGGSTGIPFGFYRGTVAFARELASKAHQYQRIGWKEGDEQFVLRGVPIRTKNHMLFYPRFNELRCSSYHLVPEWMEIFRERAFKYRPKWLKCYPSSGFLFARYLRESSKPFPPIKGVLCASENLYDFQKQLLSDVFGARVFSHYGHYEMAVLAGFCEYQDTYHVLPQYGYAELVDPNGQPVGRLGQAGEIVATSFIMSATPFVRYRTGDVAVLKGLGCAACRRPYQIWERIEGRLQEFVQTATGRLISMTAINMHDDIFDHIKQFQLVQEERGRVRFRFIPKSTCHDTQVEDMKRQLLLKFGDDVSLSMERVDDIPLTVRGKHRFLIQKLDLNLPHD